MNTGQATAGYTESARGGDRSNERGSRRDGTEAGGTVWGVLAAVALAIVLALALGPAARPAPADNATLLLLAVVALALYWTPLVGWIEAQEGGSAFVLTAAMFIVYSLARRAGPAEGPALHFAALPEDRFVVSYAAYAVSAGALLTLPFWWRRMTSWTQALLAGLSLIALLAGGSFVFLRRYFEVGPEAVLDPTVLAHLMMQVVEYGLLALLCSVAAEHPATRRRLLRALPLLLLVLWARHRFGPLPAEEG